MKQSPVQLFQTTIEKLSIEALEEFSAAEQSAPGENIDLQVREVCEAFPPYWDAQEPPVPGIEKRTFLVRLAIRTDPENTKPIPYAFDLMFSGVVACVPERLNGFEPMQAARQYGFAMVYGAMREQFLTVTSRMPYGARILPTVSFMEPDPSSATPASDDKPAKRLPKPPKN